MTYFNGIHLKATKINHDSRSTTLSYQVNSIRCNISNPNSFHFAFHPRVWCEGFKDICQFTASSLNHITWNLFHPCSRCPYHFIVLSFVRSEKNYFKMKIKKYPRICILYKCYQTFGSNLDGLIFQAPKFKPGECKFPNSSNPTPPDPSIEITFLPQHHSMLPKVAIRYLSKQRVQFICANVQYTKFR